MAASVAGMLSYWVTVLLGWQMVAVIVRGRGLALGLGILLCLIGTGFGDRLKSWIIAVLVFAGTLLFAIAIESRH